MAETPAVDFTAAALAADGTLVVLADAELALGATAAPLAPLVKRAAATARFKGKAGSVLDILAPEGTTLARLVVVGAGKRGDMAELDWLKVGGIVGGRFGDPANGTVTILAETAAGPAGAEAAADIAFGVLLGAYAYDRYKTKKKEPEDGKLTRFAVATAAGGAAAAFAARAEIAAGVTLARDLVNAPPNELGPVEFAGICEGLSAQGVAVEVLAEAEMGALGMGALLGVGQGSARGSRLAVMRWNGGAADAAPVAFVGKGVVFDTGGISIKPSANMEDMKGDMAGAAAVVGLMRALAGRKAKANVVGIVGLVENMPDGNAQRPGDIVTSMSGQTIEIINTDAEGRLVLADALWYCQERFKPQFMVNLATLTGAIVIALGSEHAGLFTNQDELAARLTDAGNATGEKVWRMPLSPDYDKAIDSKFADVKNTGGRPAGAITAAQFLQRFVNDVPWAHLDIAGAGMGPPASELNRSWGPGFGVRLLDRLVADHCEG